MDLDLKSIRVLQSHPKTIKKKKRVWLVHSFQMKLVQSKMQMT